MSISELQPTPSFLSSPGHPVSPLEQWIQAFKNYMVASGASELPAIRRKAILLNCLGLEGQRRPASFGFERHWRDVTSPGLDEFDRATAVLEDHYKRCQRHCSVSPFPSTCTSPRDLSWAGAHQERQPARVLLCRSATAPQRLCLRHVTRCIGDAGRQRRRKKTGLRRRTTNQVTSISATNKTDHKPAAKPHRRLPRSQLKDTCKKKDTASDCPQQNTNSDGAINGVEEQASVHGLNTEVNRNGVAPQKPVNESAKIASGLGGEPGMSNAQRVNKRGRGPNKEKPLSNPKKHQTN
ncbi:hypothetical protein HPB49_014021 [Dermacentor silvarum]|uniref:Uncharacterized protein n=1 Tax=Dermacentor silvarum TaxID=543639 RepID=A0ACB8C4B2_DERSI|nr:hypothetical protein HPB49_014021 [Dermacentor silvarum]